MLYAFVLSRVDDRVELEDLKTHKKIMGTLQSPDSIVFDHDSSDTQHRITRILPTSYKLSWLSNGVYPFVTKDDERLQIDITDVLASLTDIVQEVTDGSIIEVE